MPIGITENMSTYLILRTLNPRATNRRESPSGAPLITKTVWLAQLRRFIQFRLGGPSRFHEVGICYLDALEIVAEA